MGSLKNKTVLITGASSGIGAACAKIFAQNGANLLLCARRKEKIDQLAAELQQQFQSKTHCFALDVRDAKGVQEAFANLSNEWKNVDVLVNNAGLGLGLDKMPAGNIADWDQMIDTNIKGLLYVTKAVVPTMIKHNAGHIINIGSIAGHEVYAGGTVYCATKFAVKAINKGLKKDLLGTAVRISSVDPGAVETNFSTVRFKGDAERAAKVYQGFTPLTPEDIADAVYYCASRPAHVNIRELVILPTAQAAVDSIHRA